MSKNTSENRPVKGNPPKSTAEQKEAEYRRLAKLIHRSPFGPEGRMILHTLAFHAIDGGVNVGLTVDELMRYTSIETEEGLDECLVDIVKRGYGRRDGDRYRFVDCSIDVDTIRKVAKFLLGNNVMLAVSTATGCYGLDENSVIELVEMGLEPYSAKLNDVTFDEWLEFREARGRVQCAADTKNGDRCSHYRGVIQESDPKEWLKHGEWFCPVHSKDGGRS